MCITHLSVFSLHHHHWCHSSSSYCSFLLLDILFSFVNSKKKFSNVISGKLASSSSSYVWNAHTKNIREENKTSIRQWYRLVVSSLAFRICHVLRRRAEDMKQEHMFKIFFIARKSYWKSVDISARILIILLQKLKLKRVHN